MNEPVPEFQHDNQRVLWERGWYAPDGVRVLRCTALGCEQPIKPVRRFKAWNGPRSAAGFMCYECNRKRTRVYVLRGLEIKEKILNEAGGCMWIDDDGVRCHMRYPRDLRGNFALDHIDATLKQDDRETQPAWIACNEQEFFKRIRPNLQVLCTHHNNLKKSIEYNVGGIHHVNPWEREDDELTDDKYYEDVQLVIPGLELIPNPLT